MVWICNDSELIYSTSTWRLFKGIVHSVIIMSSQTYLTLYYVIVLWQYFCSFTAPKHTHWTINETNDECCQLTHIKDCFKWFITLKKKCRKLHRHTHLKHNTTYRAVNEASKRIKQQPEAAEFVPPQKDPYKSQIPRERKQCRSRWSVTTNYQPLQTGFNLLAPHLFL